MATYHYGDTARLQATAATGYSWNSTLGWQENGVTQETSSTYEFTVTAARVLVANFTKNTYTITTSASPSGGGTITGSGTYEYGASCTLIATPAKGYQFVNWTENGTAVSTSATYGFTVTGNRTLVANFSLINYYVEATSNNISYGTVAQNPSSSTVLHNGDTVTLTATPASGYKFIRWKLANGTQLSTSASYTYTVDADHITTGTTDIDIVGEFSAFGTCSVTFHVKVGNTVVDLTPVYGTGVNAVLYGSISTTLGGTNIVSVAQTLTESTSYAFYANDIQYSGYSFDTVSGWDVSDLPSGTCSISGGTVTIIPTSGMADNTYDIYATYVAPSSVVINTSTMLGDSAAATNDTYIYYYGAASTTNTSISIKPGQRVIVESQAHSHYNLTSWKDNGTTIVGQTASTLVYVLTDSNAHTITAQFTGDNVQISVTITPDGAGTIDFGYGS